ncbi:hypothetical protein [Acinetobacter sp. WCHAc060025]|uniref:hypothetical protein n=1 Tax=Acinetobacter sp. WCHAc060025 TaxID=2518625 RepID=UPI00102341DF|nr:hypothetical protein [Acinetobacter sp. WCHAc060025]RZG71828.1 hypothetical protein EXE09_17900 [Acinetobacter sp. WCHAc060025]
MIKHDLIEQVGGIERARGIVEGAPDNTATHVAVCKQNHYYRLDNGCEQTYWNGGFKDWMDSTIEESWEIFYNFKFAYVLDDLRTAIAEYDNPQLCIDCGSSDLHKGGEIKKPKMCFKCYAAMTGFTLIGDQLIEDDELAEIKTGHRIDKQLESDDCTDIRNHLSPSTRVVDL